MNDYTKSPRLYVEQNLIESDSFCFGEKTHHYLKNVLRIKDGEDVRLFNGKDGEFVGQIEHAGKKDMCVMVVKKIREHEYAPRKLHLLFSPLKKERLDFLIEKCVEIGATDFHPIVTNHSDVRKINDERIKLQIIEAAEQCERLDLPALHPATDMLKKMKGWDQSVPILAALERFDAVPLKEALNPKDCGLLIGPSGGFSEEEKQKLAELSFVTPVSLGNNILRSETAAITALGIINI